MDQDANTTASPYTARALRTSERYEVRGSLGEGGMGVVYEAFDRVRGQLVAVKTLLSMSPDALYRFKQEFRTLADVQHNNLVKFHEFVMDDGGDVFFTMELVRGTDFLRHVQTGRRNPRSVPAPTAKLSAHVDTPGVDDATGDAHEKAGASRTAQSTPADVERLRNAMTQLAGGLVALHGVGKLHRDVKPSNVLVTPEGRVVILDFGVSTEFSARPDEAAPSDEIVGTLRYMAPEQVNGEPLSPAADWYSVGVMLYEALVGRPPFFDGSPRDVLAMKSSVDPKPPSDYVEGVPRDLDALCSALLSRNPDSRPKGSEILRYLGVGRSSAPPPASATAAEAMVVGREPELAALGEAFEVVRASGATTVRVPGEPGMGKSTLVRHFLQGLTDRGDALVLRGRAYEREAVPYKGFDSVIDALSRYLIRAEEEGLRVDVPEHIEALARLFPVLQHVPSIGSSTRGAVDDPRRARRLAFGALRDLFVSLGRRRPVVVFLDDAQWADVDSAVLVSELVRPPNAPALLLVMTYRDGEDQTSPFLRELSQRWPEGAEVRDVRVGPLSREESERLALGLLDETGEAAERTAAVVAREARGCPFLLEELARSIMAPSSRRPTPLGVLTLDQMVRERLERLTPAARHAMELIAIDGRPMPVSVLTQASDLPDAELSVALLCARRFARTGLRGGQEVVESIHDRLRETIVVQIPEERRRAHHAALAQALERGSSADPEAIAVHWLSAGEGARAARFADTAAEHAVQKLAFDRAVRLLELALEHTKAQASSPEVRSLRARLAEALQFSGRYEESAREYLGASVGAPPLETVEHERAAVEQLLIGGHMAEGERMLHRVLAAIGMSAPRSTLGAVVRLLLYRAWLFIIGLRYEERPPEAISRQARVRIDALFTVSVGFSLVDVIVGACMQTRHLIEALRSGDRFQVLRAVSLEAGHLSATGKPETSRELALIEISKTIAERDGSSQALVYYLGARGIGLWNRGRWAEARPMLDRAVSVTLHGVAGFSTMRLFDVYVYYFLGQFLESDRRLRRGLAEAANLRDLYTSVNFRTGASVWMALVADNPVAARQGANAALSEWQDSRFSLQHWQALVWGAEIDLYVGDGVAAYEGLERRRRDVANSMLLLAGFPRVATLYMRARAAIASGVVRADVRVARIAEARRIARQLAREYDPWTKALSALVRAMADNAGGNRDAAVAALRRGIERAEATDTIVYAIPARHRLGELLGGAEGETLMVGAVSALTEQGVRSPQRWIACQLPGNWKK